MKAILQKDPDLDFFIGHFGGVQIPTKQDWYELLEGYEITLVEADGEEKKLGGFDFYKKEKSKNTLKKFEEEFIKQIQINLKPEHPYQRPEELEVIISVCMDEQRLSSVDVDNLSKTILDCFKGLVYEDDSQIITLLVFKEVNKFYPANGIMVGIRRLKEKSSWFGGIKLAYMEIQE